MKKTFEEAKVELIRLAAMDIITSSATGVGGGGTGNDSSDTPNTGW